MCKLTIWTEYTNLINSFDAGANCNTNWSQSLEIDKTKIKITCYYKLTHGHNCGFASLNENIVRE